MLFWSPGSNISLWATFSSWTRMIFLSNVYNRRFSCDISFTNFSVKAFVCPFHKYCMHPNPLVFSLSEAQAVFMVPKTPKSLIWCLPPSSSHHPPLPVPEMEPIIPLDASLHQGWCQAGSGRGRPRSTNQDTPASGAWPHITLTSTMCKFTPSFSPEICYSRSASGFQKEWIIHLFSPSPLLLIVF